MINKLTSAIRNLSDRTIKIIGYVLVISYYFIGLLSYITNPIKSFYLIFVSTSIVAIIMRAALCGLICIYSIMVLIKYELKVKCKWLCLFLFLLFMTLISILLSPLQYEYMYVDNLYKVVHAVQLNPGVPRTIVMFFSSIADFAFAFCILFVLPYVINDKKKLLYLLIPIVLICLLECGYSAIKEKENYIYLFNHPDDPFGGYNNDIGATFGNKEDWGSFLTVSFTASIFSFYFIKGDTPFKKLLKVFFIGCCGIFTVFAVLSLCKTAMLAMLLFYICLAIGIAVHSIKKSKISAIVTISTLSVILAAIILFFVTNGFGVRFLGKIKDFLINFIINRSASAVESRQALWLNYMENVRGFNLFFGMGKANVFSYTKSLTPDRQSGIHNGFAYFFACYGLFGILTLAVLFYIVIRNFIKLWRSEKYLIFILFGALLASVSFILAESEVLIISTSIPIYVFNILLCVLPSGLCLVNNKEVCNNEK